MIITHTKDADIRYAYLNIYPDQFVSNKEKESDSWIKPSMDYFANFAYAQYVRNAEGFSRNYNLLKGIIDRRDFYEDVNGPEVASFMDSLTVDLSLPSRVQHYSILNTPVNTLVGELSKRPDNTFVKAFDDDSKSEKLQARTDILQQYIIQEAKQNILAKLAQQGEPVPDEKDLNQLTMDHVEEYMVGYTSLAEQWSNHVLKALKMEFNLKDKLEDGFRDLLVSSRQFYHIFEDNSKIGFSVEVSNPKNTWFLTLPDRKYTSDPSSRTGAYAAGTVEVMELSEILEKFDLSDEEVEHLRNGIKQFNLLNVRESNYVNSNNVGYKSVTYDVYDPLVLEERQKAESMLKDNDDQLRDFMGLSNNVTAFGNKYAVIRAYWASKQKQGLLSYLDEDGVEQTMRVDETYVSGSMPTQLSLEWGWINRWYQGYKIGPDIYDVKPLKILDYCPIIGVLHEIKNTQLRSIVDLMKPFQVIYNICMNQLYDLLDKEIGNVYLTSIRQIPTPKDGDGQDALDVWEEEARRRGVLFLDDSPENMKGPSNFNQFRNVDLTRTSEIESRYRLAIQMKKECWELIGVSDQRAGEVAATETATGTQAALSQSFAQTEPLFAAHSYTTNMLYQAILDSAQYIESHKPLSTIQYVTSEGEDGFIQVNGSEISNRDLKVFVTDRAEDLKALQDLRSLSQPMLQNGATPYEIMELYTTTSMRKMKQIAKKLKDELDQFKQNEQQQKQQELQQSQQQFEANIQHEDQVRQEDEAFEASEHALDRINKKEVAFINQFAKGNDPLQPTAPDGQPDILEYSRLSADQAANQQKSDLENRKLQQQQKEHNDKMGVEMQKLAAEKERTRADLQKSRNDIRKAKITKAAKPTPKKK